MKLVTIICMLLVSVSTVNAQSLERAKAVSKVEAADTGLDETIQLDACKYIFTFNNFASDRDDIVVLMTYTIDGKKVESILGEYDRLEIMTTPGEHEFEFNIPGFKTVKTGVLEVPTKHYAFFNVQLAWEDC